MIPLTVGSLFSPSGGDIIEKLTVLDLFSGIGGFSLGLQRTGGFETIAFCEIDPFCRKVLAKHWPGVPCFEDITKLDKEELDSLGRVDVICGGFPCQDISCAGKGAGIHAERSGLWWEMLRIIRLVRPRFVLVENVAALLNRGLDEVLGSLAESGYDARWQILRACDFGLPHRRERLYLIANCESLRRATLLDGMGKKAKQRRYSESPGSFWGYEPALCVCAPGYTYPRLARLDREDNGIPDRVDRLRALGNAIVPQCAQFVGQCLLDSIRTEAAQ
ncbi:MAG: DNA (cytosine-5-)-methyltransferase [Desulfobacterales bacterium]|nr:DNA (cytosine-5-)-methyltransferase [Desulfobacterales bacterium]